MTLRLDWCSHAAAKYAVMHWHYSGRMPAGKAAHVGVWEHGQFIGALIFSRGATPRLGTPYGLNQTELCELTRIALTTHDVPVSRVMAIAVRMLRQQSPGLRLIVSFADPDQKHVGAIYQAANWLYTGTSDVGGMMYLIDGKWTHTRTIAARYGSQSQSVVAQFLPDAVKRRPSCKYRYLYPLDAAMRAQIAPLAKPYPKRASSIVADAPAIHAGEGGSIPTDALQSLSTLAVGDG